MKIMKEIAFYICAVTVITMISVIFICFADEGNKSDRNTVFLEKYGWEVGDDFIEKEEIIIPEEFDDVYMNYNDMQKEAGLDMEPYKGKKAVRYTYEVKNYPSDIPDVRANVICVDGRPIAGDIMTVKLDGFMHSLKRGN